MVHGTLCRGTTRAWHAFRISCLCILTTVILHLESYFTDGQLYLADLMMRIRSEPRGAYARLTCEYLDLAGEPSTAEDLVMHIFDLTELRLEL